MYYPQPNWWYYPCQSKREETMMPNNMPQMNDMQQQQMMEMMRQHMKMTEEIRQMVYDIHERFKLMEHKMMN